ncbi:hypothetical protein CSOJ01_08994 [Colletotrichum sojae]|uniref:Uncharacterized protein n=1 Tax=Colletotrichum sojae TaxID=2175907 RepID=A0A8H6MR93_9PEZI|nr:hypothetical protein CSOJ01_08994 [Colletotrichum sojae]
MEFFKVYFKPTDYKGSGPVGLQQVELPPGGVADADDVVMSSQRRASSRRETPAGAGDRGQLLLAARRQEPTSHRQRPRARLTSWRSKLDGCPATFMHQASYPQIPNSCSASVGSIPPTVHPTIEWASASPSSQTRTPASRTCSVAAAGRAVGGGTACRFTAGRSKTAFDGHLAAFNSCALNSDVALSISHHSNACLAPLMREASLIDGPTACRSSSSVRGRVSQTDQSPRSQGPAQTSLDGDVTGDRDGFELCCSVTLQLKLQFLQLRAKPHPLPFSSSELPRSHVSSREPKGFWQVRIVYSERRSVRAARDDVVASDKKPPKRGVQLEQGGGSQPSTHSHLIEQDASEPDRARRRQDQDYGQGRWAGPSERLALGLAERVRESGRELWPVAMAEMERKPCELPICPSRSPAHPSKSHVFGPGLAPCVKRFTSAKTPAFKHASDHGSQCPGRTATQHPYHDSHRAILCQTCLKTLIAGYDPATEKCSGLVAWALKSHDFFVRSSDVAGPRRRQSRDDSRRRCNGVEGKSKSNKMSAATELRRTGGDWAGRYASSPLIFWTAKVMSVVRTSCLSSEARRSSWHGKADDGQRRAMIETATDGRPDPGPLLVARYSLLVLVLVLVLVLKLDARFVAGQPRDGDPGEGLCRSGGEKKDGPLADR